MPLPSFKNLEHQPSLDGDEALCTLLEQTNQRQQALEEKINACVDFDQCILNVLHHLSFQLGNNAMLAECVGKSTVSTLPKSKREGLAFTSENHAGLAFTSEGPAATNEAPASINEGLPDTVAREPSEESELKERATTTRRKSCARLSWDTIRTQRKKAALETRRATGVTQANSGDLLKNRRVSDRIRTAVADQRFDLFFGGIVLMNAVCLGFQVDNKSKGSSMNRTLSDVLDLMEYAFTFFFLIELVCRIVAARLSFFYNEDWTWNLFDCLVVIASLMEFFVSLFDSGSTIGFTSNLSVARIVRAVRMVRVVRVLRLFSFFRPLRILVHAIAKTIRSCFWALMLLALLLYVFAIVFCQVATDFKAQCEKEETPDCSRIIRGMNKFYNSPLRTFSTLFMSVTGGIDWEAASMALFDLGWVYGLLFTLYISFVYFAMMNVITGLFCQTALESVQADTDHVIAEKIKQKDAYTHTLQKLCAQIDSSGDGQITIDEFIALADDPRLNQVLKSIDIDVEDAWLLFELLDVREDGIIVMDDFVEGCLRLKGQAKGVHIHQLLYEHRWIMDKIADIHGALPDVAQAKDAKKDVLTELRSAPTWSTSGSNKVAREIRTRTLSSYAEEDSVNDHRPKSPNTRTLSYNDEGSNVLAHN